MRFLLAGMLVLLFVPAARALEIVSAGLEGEPVAGRPLQIVVEARGGADGARLTFPELLGGVDATACGLRPVAGVTRFSLPYRPSWIGTHVLSLTVTAGACGARPRSAWRLVRFEAIDGAPVARAPAPAECADAGTQPIPRLMRASRAAVVCLLNRERAALGLAPLTGDERLRRTASRRAHAVRRGRGGPARPGEQRTVATGELSSPARVLATWLASDAHRRDLLDPAVSRIGVSVVPSVSGPQAHPGATYVVALA